MAIAQQETSYLGYILDNGQFKHQVTKVEAMPPMHHLN